MRRGRRVLRGAVLAGVTLLVAEMLARRTHLPDPHLPDPASVDQPAILLHGNPWLLWELAPGTRMERGVVVNVNTRGFRGPEVGLKRGPRALTLGDSSIYGFGVADADTWSAQLATRLGVDIVNGAVPGYSTFQARNALELRGLSVDPDVLFIGTLWSDNNFDGFVDKRLLAAWSAWEGGAVATVRRGLERVALFRWLDWTLRVQPQGRRARAIGWDLSDRDVRSGERRVAIEDYAANLDALAATMHARGGGVVFLLPANRDDLDPRGTEPAWEPYRAVLRDAAARHDAPLVDVPRAFRESGDGVEALFLDKMHPTPLGHRRMAEAAAAVLRARGWPRKPLRTRVPTASPRIPEDPWAHHVVPEAGAEGGSPPSATPPPTRRAGRP